MAEGGYFLQNQLRFNLDVPLSAAYIAHRHHKPKAIVIERAGRPAADHPHPLSHGPVSHPQGQSGLNLSNVSEDRLALAVQLAKRDIKRRKEQKGSPARTPSPKGSHKTRRPLVSKGGTKIIQTKECRERAQRLQEKRGRDPLKVREQGWNSGTSTVRTQTPPRDRRQNMPVTTNSPPTRDTDSYLKQWAKPDNPIQEIGRLQKEIEGYLQQIQVIEQRAMTDQTIDGIQPKSRKKDGYLSDEEDPARSALRQEEQATRAARQVYFLRQQVRSLQEVVTRKGSGKVKHTKKSQVMLRLAAAHRGAVRAIQSFVNQHLPQQDLRRGLPTGYHELALLIRQLALVSTQIKAEKDKTDVHEDLIKMLDRVDDLNKAWCSERDTKTDTIPGECETEGDRRRKSPQGRQPPEREATRGRQLQPRRAGKENRPKGLLKKQFIKQTKTRQQEPRKLTPERQNILRAGLESLVREDPSLHQRPSGMTWNIPMETSMVSEQPSTGLILPKGLQHKREKAQKSAPLAVPQTHFTDPTVSFHLKTVHPDDTVSSPSREPWRPGGSLHSSPARQPRSKSAERTRSLSRSRSQGQSRSKSPRSRMSRQVVISDVDQELISELFPRRQQRQPRSRSASPSRPRSASPGSPGRMGRSPLRLRSGRAFAHSARGRLQHLYRGAKDAGLARGLQGEAAEISLREMLAQRALEKAEISGEILSDMILQDVLRDTAEELESLEDEDNVRSEAVTMHHNPTLENMYQRLEQMELEQNDIRRRWGTLHFHEETNKRAASLSQRPSAPVAMEITRQQPHSQSHRVQSSREFNKDAVEPIIFTKSAPASKFHKKTTPLANDNNIDDDNDEELFRPTQRGPQRIRLKISETVVRDIKNNFEKYERHLRKTQHEKEGRFDPWTLVEEISDQVLEECLQEIDRELDEIGEGIVHRVCRSEFSVPDPAVVAEQLAAERERLAKEEAEQQAVDRERQQAAEWLASEKQQVELIVDKLADRRQADALKDRMESNRIDYDRNGNYHESFRSEVVRSGRVRPAEDGTSFNGSEQVKSGRGRIEEDRSRSNRAEVIRTIDARTELDISDLVGTETEKAKQAKTQVTRDSRAEYRAENIYEQNGHEISMDYEKDINETPRGEFESENDEEDDSPRLDRFESLGDIEDLQPVDTETEIQTARDSEHVADSIEYDQSEVRQIERQSEVRQIESFSQNEGRGGTRDVLSRADSYEEDYEEEEEEDDDVEEVSPIDTDDLEYSTDET